MTVDTSGTLEIPASPARLAGLALAAVAMTGLSAIIALRLFEVVPQGGFTQTAGWIGIVFFAQAAVALAWRAARGTQIVVTMLPKAIRDTRVSQDYIPWSAVRDISTWNSGAAAKGPRWGPRWWPRSWSAPALAETRVMVLAVDPEVEAGLRLTRMARWTRGMNRSLGADGLCVAATGLAVGHDELLAAATAYWRDAAGPGPVEALFAETAEQTLGQSFDHVVAALAGHELQLALAERPTGDGNLQLLTSKDNRDLMWPCLYADDATAERYLLPGTTVMHTDLSGTLDIVATMENVGGIAIYAGDQSYLIPDEYLDRARQLLAPGSSSDAPDQRPPSDAS